MLIIPNERKLLERVFENYLELYDSDEEVRDYYLNYIKL